MSGRTPLNPDQWDEAELWLAKAAEDAGAARLLVREDYVFPAAFHAQQALEKLLKALLVAASRDIRRTHDIEELAAEAHRYWPDLISWPFLLSHLSDWYQSSRYPDMDEAPPSSSGIVQALSEIEALLAAVNLSIKP